MLTADEKKMLHKFAGWTWHEIKFYEGSSSPHCLTCDMFDYPEGEHENHTLDTEKDFSDLCRALEGKGWLDDFYDWAEDVCIKEGLASIAKGKNWRARVFFWVIESPERSIGLICQYLKERK